MTQRKKHRTVGLKIDLPTRPITDTVDLDTMQVMWEESGRGILAKGCRHRRAGEDPLNPFRTIERDYEGW